MYKMRMPSFFFCFHSVSEVKTKKKSFLHLHNTRCTHNTNSLPASLKLNLFVHFGRYNPPPLSPRHAGASYFPSDGEEMGYGKEIDHHGVDISHADKWQPQTWKAISRQSQGVKRGQAPHRPLLPKAKGSCQAATRRQVFAPPHIPSGLHCYTSQHVDRGPSPSH